MSRDFWMFAPLWKLVGVEIAVIVMLALVIAGVKEG